MCVGEWSSKGFIKDCDLKVAVALPEVDGEEEIDLEWG
jgi:hypothetical protein